MTGLGDRLAALDGAQRAALERALLARRRPAVVAVRPRDRTRPTPLSPSQRRLWFLDQLSPGSPTYNAVVAFRARGPLDLAALVAVFEQIVERHEVLHTVMRGDPPEQVVLERWDLVHEHLDLSAEPADTRDALALRAARDFCRRPYDLGADLPIRLLTVATGREDHLVVVAEHHIAFDGWSDEIMFRELSEGYAARRGGTGWCPEPLALQYADVAAFWATSPPDPGHDEFWRTTFADPPPPVDLPTDRPHPAVQSFDGRHLDVAVRGVRPALAAVRGTERATTYMVVSALFAAAVHRWSGCRDLVMGTPMANRLRAEFEPLIGFFSNTVPVRVRLDGAMTAREVVAAFRDADITAMEHQSAPFERIVELSRARRDAGRNPLFQVNVRVQQAGPALPTLDGVEVEAVAIDLGFARFDLALDLSLIGDDLVGYLEYNTAIFDDATVARFAAWLTVFVTDALRRPDLPVDDLRFGEPSSGPRRRRAVTAT